MKKYRFRLFAAVCLLLFTSGQTVAQIVWTDLSSQYQLPAGVKIIQGERASPFLRVYYIDVDGNNPNIAIHPYYSSSIKSIVPFAQSVGAIAAINGGFFGGSASYSAVVYPDSVVQKNIGGVTRPAGAYTMTRSLFSMNIMRKYAVDWIYHFGNATKDIYRFAIPTPNTQTTPAPAPVSSNGKSFDSILVGIGGAPTLVKNGQVHVTYDEEVMFGSGVGLDNGDPRTAVGYTADDHVIMLVADGRGTSVGVSLPELAQIMIDLGCVEAMNLDGGGSTQMGAKTSGGYAVVNTPSETRSIPSILAVVPIDSAKFPAIPTFQRIMDTGDDGVSIQGTGWIDNSTTGYWGTTKAKLAQLGVGNNLITFKPHNLPTALLDVQAWWPNISINSKDTPFTIRHKNGTDTVRVDQSVNSGKWTTIGAFTFAGDTNDAVTISDNASTGFVVCADAIRFVSYDPNITSVKTFADNLPSEFVLRQNYPNPFNPVTTITFSLPHTAGTRHILSLRIYDLLGREIATLVNGEKPPGKYSVQWNAVGQSSGVYFMQLRSGNLSITRKINLIR
ncbi:MAG: phosphodiester glycosidase family protein [Bacteroidota bacterium]